jgi:hypothetical protein
MEHLVSAGMELAEQVFRIDKILGATQGYDVDFHAYLVMLK